MSEQAVEITSSIAALIGAVIMILIAWGGGNKITPLDRPNFATYVVNAAIGGLFFGGMTTLILYLLNRYFLN